jgi:hypothetical protein
METEDIQFLLCGLRKDDHSYYLQKFLANLDAFEITTWKYKLMQILLAVSILPSILFRRIDLLGIFGIIFVINMFINVKS